MFSYKDDPFSTVTPPTRLPPDGTDTTIYTGYHAVNESGNTLPDVGIWLPYLYVTLPQPNGQLAHEALTWDNGRDGWFTPNFIDASGHATGESLLVTEQISTGDMRVAAGNVANASGKQQYPLKSSDFLKGQNKWPLETIQTTDRLPFSDLGTLGPHQSKSFDIAFTAHWGGADLGAVRVGGWITTLVPNTGSPSGGGSIGGSAFDG